MALPLFMEFQRNISGGHNFDVYDIIASLISMVFVYFLLEVIVSSSQSNE